MFLMCCEFQLSGHRLVHVEYFERERERERVCVCFKRESLH